MVRINLVPPEELTDQHLRAEYNEILMLCGCLRKSLKSKRGLKDIHKSLDIPKFFTLGRGHIKFFFDKGLYLDKRFMSIRVEMIRRGFNPQKPFPIDSWLEDLYNDWEPDPESLSIVRKRIAARIALKPHWYRYYGNKIQ